MTLASVDSEKFDKMYEIVQWVAAAGGKTWGGNYPYGEPGERKCMDCHATRDYHTREDCVVKLAQEILGVEFEHPYWDNKIWVPKR